MADPIVPPDTTQTTGEDTFFVLRGCRELFLRRLADIVRRAGVTTPGIVDAFTDEVGTAYDELLTASKQDGFGLTDGLTASRISLVGNDDLELEIRIGDLIAHLKSNERIDRWRVQLRFMTLLNRPAMTAEANPAGLEPISRGLWEICRMGLESLDDTLDRLDGLETQLQADLPELYLELNDFLEQQGVETAQVRPVQRASGAAWGNANATTAGGMASAAQAGNALSSLLSALSQQFSGDAQWPAAGLHGAVTGLPGELANHAPNAAMGASALTMLNHLMERLDALEHQQAATQGTAEGEPATPPLRAIRSRDLDLPQGKPTSVALDTLSFIFDAIFESADLPDVVKTIIGRLQIPLLKVAIVDETFFADTKHPARQLINRIGRAALGLAPDTARDHALCLRLAGVADAVRHTLESHERDLQPHVDELDAIIEERDKAVQAAAVPYARLIVDHERRAAAGTHARNWLRGALQKTSEPTVRRLLSDYWFDIMKAAAIAGGTTGTRWKEDAATIDDLLWSIQPKSTAEDRKKLVALVPTLIRRLNAALDAQNVSAEARAPFLNACFDLQTAALRNRPDTPTTPAGSAHNAPINEIPLDESLTNPARPANPGGEMIEQQGRKLRYIGQATAIQPTWRTGRSAAKPGTWLGIQLPDGDTLSGRHCGTSTETGSVLLFNPDWDYAVALTHSVLELQLSSGQARVLSTTALFDEAAERALGQLAGR